MRAGANTRRMDLILSWFWSSARTLYSVGIKSIVTRTHQWYSSSEITELVVEIIHNVAWLSYLGQLREWHSKQQPWSCKNLGRYRLWCQPAPQTMDFGLPARSCKREPTSRCAIVCPNIGRDHRSWTNAHPLESLRKHALNLQEGKEKRSKRINYR